MPHAFPLACACLPAPPPHSGADDFTPVLIYTVIRAQPEALASNLAFVERYRMVSRLVSESMYFFVQMVGPRRLRTYLCTCQGARR